MGRGGKRSRSGSDAAQDAGAASTQVNQHKSKMLKGDESPAAATANAESFDDAQPFHYATVLKVPGGHGRRE